MRLKHCLSRFFLPRRWLLWAVCFSIQHRLEAFSLVGRLLDNVGLHLFSVDGASLAFDRLLNAVVAAAFNAELCIVLVEHDSCSGYFTNFSYCFEF